MDVADIVRQEIQRCVARRRATVAPSLSADASLADLGLDSLDLHELAETLEDATGLNPFEQRLAVTDMHTVSDLCDAYTSATAGSPVQDDLVESSRRRAEARRRRRRV
jgi:acyl carrier protein